MDSLRKRRYSIRLSGIVQGVGFRPYIFQKASKYHICGWVNNTGAAVLIDAEGDSVALKRFAEDIIRRPPVLALVEKIEIRKQKYVGYKDFEIRQSDPESTNMKLVSPDIGVCGKCMREVCDPHSRRYRYAFTNCTECGPRYSIIRALPYDRCSTTMKDFSQCRQCENEYQDPESRRFHTQPNCCSDCGPLLSLNDEQGGRIDCTDPIKRTVELIKEGKIVAIKGIGGFHLCCDAMNEEAINKLRMRKNRPHKPLAVMAANIEIALKHCELSLQEQAILISPKRPIVLLRKKGTQGLSENIAPGHSRLGVMLPYSPLHHLLFENGLEILIMTSGNRSGEPIQYENKTAVRQLCEIADYFLLHNRDIHNPVDDSVVKVVAGREMVSRRARGYIPYALNLGVEEHEILALGAEQKSTVCISQYGYVYMSQYLGDLKDMLSYEYYKQVIKNLIYLFQFNPKVYVHDLHPQYLSTWYAQKQQSKTIAVQHHHAHMVSCMVEQKLFERVIGIVFDGTGFGEDGSIWGGEFFVGDRRHSLRVGHIKQVLLQGGDNAVKEPWRTAVCYLHSMGIEAHHYLSSVSRLDIEVIQRALTANFNCHLSSSMGRLFDCAAALIGVRERITYDAQAAIELENLIDSSIDTGYCYSIDQSGDTFQLDYENIITGILEDRKNNVMPSVISARFHNTISNAAADMVLRVRNKYGINSVVLSGGVFENGYLLETMLRKLKTAGFHVFFNEQIPINDSGISIGQLVIANEMLGE